MFSSRYGNDRCTALFLQHCADVNLTDKNNSTALHFASQHGYNKIVALLLQNDENVNLTDDTNSTPLFLANQRGRDKCTDIIVQTVLHHLLHTSPILLCLEQCSHRGFKEKQKDFNQIRRGARHCDYPGCKISDFATV